MEQSRERSRHLLDEALTTLESNFAVLMGDPKRVHEALTSLEELLAGLDDPDAVRSCHGRLMPLVKRQMGPLAQELFRFLERRCRSIDRPSELVMALLEARDPGLRQRAVDLMFDLGEEGRLVPDMKLVLHLARLVEEPTSALRAPAPLARIGGLLGRLAGSEIPPGGADPVDSLFLGGSPPLVRCLAARVLDRDREPVPPRLCERLLGARALRVLAPYLAYTCATHRDLVDLTPDPGSPPPILTSLARAEQMLGQKLLASAIGQLGWARVAWGVSVRHLIGVSVGGSFPFAVEPREAELLEACGAASRKWDRFLIVAHGGGAGETEAGDSSDSLGRFRRYNVAHAEALDDILELAPLTPAKTRRIIERLERIVADYVALFADHAQEVHRVPGVLDHLRSRVLALLDGAVEDQPLSAEATRLVQMFEDPRNLDEVRTLHGLKRFLHQQGLRHAFGLFRSSRTTNRTVDLMLADSRRVLQACHQIKYLDFEPEGGEGLLNLPFPVMLAVDAMGRHLVNGDQSLPALEILRYGNEVQVYIHFRNHPAFLRLDLSPPLRGGMIDLEYFGASQYELDHHPDLSLNAIQQLIRKLDFDVELTGLRLHVRYDKERALDLGDIVEKASALFRLVPYLMDADWLVGGLDYPVAVRKTVADAWAEFFVRWGVLPTEQCLTRDRRQILRGIASDASGEREIPWDGRGDYQDRLSDTPPADLLDRLREVLEKRGLESVVSWVEEAALGPAQLPLERAVLESLRGALARNEVTETADGLVPAPEALFQREHEAQRLAEILREGGPALERAVRLAATVAGLERQFRFRTTGSVQGYPVQRAVVPLSREKIAVYILRDGQGNASLGLAVPGAALFRRRTGPDAQWMRQPDLDAEEFVRRLRRDNYLAAGFETVTDRDVDRALQGASRIRTPDPGACPDPLPDDRTVQGVVASPGRAAGLARFGTRPLTPRDLAGAVLLAPAIRPEDAPLLRHAAAIVSTGGGILSHVGLIALELRKPGLIIAGRWRHDAAGNPVLVYRRPEFQEERGEVGDLIVVRRRHLREREEVLEEGDLVVVDAEAGSLIVLGHERDAPNLHQELQLLEEAAEHLVGVEEGPEQLVLRGRLLRAVHQLEKLLARIDCGALARHAVQELLRVPRGPGSRVMLASPLKALFANPRCGETARLAARQRLEQLGRRHGALSDVAERSSPSATGYLEMLYLRSEMINLDRTAREVAGLLAACGLDVPAIQGMVDLDDLLRRRLVEMHADLSTQLGRVASVAAEPGGILRQEWRLGQLLGQIDRLERLLGRQAGPDRPSLVQRARQWEASLVSGLAQRRVVVAGDGGAELTPLIGAKGAGLGEMARALGPGFVPPWFAVTDRAFREVLQMPPPRRVVEALGIATPCPTVRHAVQQVLGTDDWETPRRALAIRTLWQEVALPPSLEQEVLKAYWELLDDPGGSARASEPEGPFVAIRSSAFEEDTQSASWAGQFDTFLFIRGERALLEHLKLAWAGLWSERALDHRQMLGTDHSDAGGGIVVQRMVDSRVSGVLHTVSVATGQLGEMVINVGLGLGVGIVSGLVDVDQIHVIKGSPQDGRPLGFRYRVGDKRERVVHDSRSGLGTRVVETIYHQRLRPALEYVEIAELVGTAARLERLQGQPLDLEFAIEGSRLFVLQARPVPLFGAVWAETVDRNPLGRPPTVSVPGVRDIEEGHP